MWKLVCLHTIEQGTLRNLKATGDLKPVSDVDHTILCDTLWVNTTETSHCHIC